MNQQLEEEMALKALLAVAAEHAPGLPHDIFRQAFAIQKRHQFDRNEQNKVSVQDMQALMERFVDEQMSSK